MITVYDDGPVAVAVISSMGPDNLSVVVPMAFADPHIQFLRNGRRRHTDGRTAGHKENNLAHFQTPELFLPLYNSLRCALFRHFSPAPIPPRPSGHWTCRSSDMRMGDSSLSRRGGSMGSRSG
jgi:hypothetical protein